MSDADPTTQPAADTHGHQAVGHDDGHGGDAESEPLGPLDAAGWGAALLGGFVGLLAVLALYVATNA